MKRTKQTYIAKKLCFDRFNLLVLNSFNVNFPITISELSCSFTAWVCTLEKRYKQQPKLVFMLALVYFCLRMHVRRRLIIKFYNFFLLKAKILNDLLPSLCIIKVNERENDTLSYSIKHQINLYIHHLMLLYTI